MGEPTDAKFRVRVAFAFRVFEPTGGTCYENAPQCCEKG